jgi:uncharacterized protein (TIGR02453 family)
MIIQKSTLDFLKNLKLNNHKDWFEEHRKQYDAAKKNVLDVAEQTIKTISLFDSDIKDLQAKNCMFRINRDVRFSNDKSPYKTNMGAYFAKGGKKSVYAGYYLHVEPGKSFLAGGLWMPQSEQLNKVRQEIDYNALAFKKIIYNKDFVNYFNKLDEKEKLRTIPKGYPKDHPEAELLKLKSYIVSHALSDITLTSKELSKQISAAFKAMNPLIKFINTALD